MGTGVPWGGRSPPLDLEKHPPRSPFAALGGVVTLPRCIDKMRADLAGTAGAYKATTGNISTRLFSFLDVTPEAFAAVVAANADDAGVLAALRSGRWPPAAAIDAWNRESVARAPENDERWARHWRLLREAGYGARTDIRTVFDRLLAEDGVGVPPGGTAWSPGDAHGT